MITTEITIFTFSSHLCWVNKYLSRVYSVPGIEQHSIFDYHLIIDSFDSITTSKSFFHCVPHILSPLPLEKLAYL